MSKNIKIAALGIAAFATAAAPMMAMALGSDNTTVTDNIQVTVDESCALSVVSRANGTSNIGSWGEGTTHTGFEETLAGTVVNSSNTDNYGSTKMKVICNNYFGWEVTAVNTALTSEEGLTIPAADDHSATKSGWSWKVSQVDDNGLTLAGGGNVKQGATGEAGASVAKIQATAATGDSKATGSAGKEFTVTYGVGIDANQGAGTYKGSITYTLAQLNTVAN